MVTHQLQVERRTGKVRQSETDVLPLCHATNLTLTTETVIWYKGVLGTAQRRDQSRTWVEMTHRQLWARCYSEFAVYIAFLSWLTMSRTLHVFEICPVQSHWPKNRILRRDIAEVDGATSSEGFRVITASRRVSTITTIDLLLPFNGRLSG